MSKSEFEILFVLFCQRRNADDGSGQVDSFVFSQDAAIHDFTLDVIALNRAYAEFDQSIRQQNSRTRLYFARQGFERGRDDRMGAGNFFRCNGDSRARFERYRSAIFEPAGTDLRTLKVLQNTNRSILRCRHFPYGAD